VAQSGRILVNTNKLLVAIQVGALLDQLKDYQLCKKKEMFPPTLKNKLESLLE
jgi:hypothetical protein